MPLTGRTRASSKAREYGSACRAWWSNERTSSCPSRNGGKGSRFSTATRPLRAADRSARLQFARPGGFGRDSCTRRVARPVDRDTRRDRVRRLCVTKDTRATGKNTQIHTGGRASTAKTILRRHSKEKPKGLGERAEKIMHVQQEPRGSASCHSASPSLARASSSLAQYGGRASRSSTATCPAVAANRTAM